MGLSTFWTNVTGPRVREITPRKQGHHDTGDRRPATSSGVRTIRRTPSLDDDDDGDRELNLVESLLTTNIIEPPPASAEPTFDEKKARRRSRGLSLSRSKIEDGPKRRRSLFGGNKDAAKKEEVPEVPTLPTLSAIYSRQAPHTLSDIDRPSTAVSAIASPISPRVDGNGTVAELPAFGGSRPAEPPNTSSNSGGEVFELPAELPASIPTTKAIETSSTAKDIKKSRRRSLGEVLTGKRPKSMAYETSGSTDVPPTPALPATKAIQAPKIVEITAQKETGRSRKNSNASVASKASKMSRKSKRKSWWQRAKAKDEEVEALPPMPAGLNAQREEKPAKDANSRKTPSPGDVDLSAFPTVPAAKKSKDDDDAASIRTTRSEKAGARLNPQLSKSKKRPQSTISTCRKRRSWWASSNPDDSDDGDDSNPLPPVPLLIRSNRTTPDSSPTNSDHQARTPSYTAVRGDTIHAPRPVSVSSTKSRTYVPRSAAKSFLVSTTPVADNVRKSVRHSLHGGAVDDPDAGFENDSGTYCLSAEQQREWEKLKHLMAVMERRRDVTMKRFGEASVGEMFPDVPRGGMRGGDGEKLRDEEREGVKYSNRDALAALEVGVAK